MVVFIPAEFFLNNMKEWICIFHSNLSFIARTRINVDELVAFLKKIFIQAFEFL